MSATAAETPRHTESSAQPQARAAFIVTPIVAGAWLIGMLAQTWLGAPLWLALGAAAGGSAFVGAAVLGKMPGALTLVAAVLALFWLGAARTAMSGPDHGPGGILHYADGSAVRLVGVVEGDPTGSASGKSVALRLAARQIWPDGARDPRDVSGLLQVRVLVPHDNAGAIIPTRPWQAGDLIEADGRLEPIDPHATSDDAGYKQYLVREGIYARIDYPAARLLATNQDNPVVHALNDLRHAATDIIDRTMTRPESGLVIGIMLGDKSQIPKWVLDVFYKTGTYHIVAISGSNISIVIAFVSLLLGRLLGKRNAFVIAVLVVIAYAIMVGLSASVVRAALMGCIAAFAVLIGRDYYALTSLSAAAFLMTLFDPRVIWDIGFQLSFLATFGVIVIAPPLQKRLRRVPHILRETAALTIAAEIMTAPLVAFYFYLVPPYISVPANMLVEPDMAVIMAFSAVALVVGAFAVWLPFLTLFSSIVGAVARLFPAYMIGVLQAIAATPFDTPYTLPVTPLFLAYYYTALLLLLVYARLRNAGDLPDPMRAFAARIRLSRWQSVALVLAAVCGGLAAWLLA